MVADKLASTAVMFINIELLAEYFYLVSHKYICQRGAAVLLTHNPSIVSSRDRNEIGLRNVSKRNPSVRTRESEVQEAY